MRHILQSAIAVTLLFAGPAPAHHSQAAFDRTTSLNLRGTVSRYAWSNPHVYIFLDVPDDSGESREWRLEADPTPLMSRSGWTSSTLVPGDRVLARINPAQKPGIDHGLLVSLTKDGGETLGMRDGALATKRQANDISGTWDALANFSSALGGALYDPNRAYTAAGRSARAAYTVEQFPPAACLAFPTPWLLMLPYLVQIEIGDDRILIRSEFYAVERTVYMDGRGHPEGGERTIQGHSVGHWEGKTLVVDTGLFADYQNINGPGIPSGARKHTIERFALSDDRTELEYSVLVEDLEFVVEPFSISTSWDFAPDRAMEPFDCDPDVAQFYLAR